MSLGVCLCMVQNSHGVRMVVMFLFTYKGEGCNAIHVKFVEVMFRFILSF